MWLLDRMLRALIRQGRLVVTNYDGRIWTYGDPSAEPVQIRFTRKNTAWRIARDPRLGAGEAYMDGDLVVEKPYDVRDLVLLVMGNGARAGK